MIKGVSGGERKRTSIAVELITDPSIIFLDEPTTGLDSYTSTQLMTILKDLAKSGRVVIQTIHQPNSEIFVMFDKLMLLAKGKVIYFNESSLSRDYFKKIDFICPNLANPADYYMLIMSKESIEIDMVIEGFTHEEIKKDSIIEYEKRITKFVKSYESSDL